jgi:hypothetical protein
MPTYDIDVTRDGRWWMIHIPALDGLTQARFPGEIEDMARDFIALVTDTPIGEIRVNRREITVSHAPDASELEAIERWLNDLDPNDPIVRAHNVEGISAATNQLLDAIADAIARDVPVHFINGYLDDFDDRLSVLLPSGETTPLDELVVTLGIDDQVDEDLTFNGWY